MRISIPLLAIATLVLVPDSAAAQDAQERLWHAAMAGDTAAIRAAVADGADVQALDVRRNENGRRALNWAALYDQPAAIALLLELGADIHAFNRTGFTALHHAAEGGSIAATRMLLAAGADRTIGTFEGWTPMDIAVELGHLEIAALLSDTTDD